VATEEEYLRVVENRAAAERPSGNSAIMPEISDVRLPDGRVLPVAEYNRAFPDRVNAAVARGRERARARQDEARFQTPPATTQPPATTPPATTPPATTPPQSMTEEVFLAEIYSTEIQRVLYPRVQIPPMVDPLNIVLASGRTLPIAQYRVEYASKIQDAVNKGRSAGLAATAPLELADTQLEERPSGRMAPRTAMVPSGGAVAFLSKRPR
jgi:hypothetical protein